MLDGDLIPADKLQLLAALPSPPLPVMVGYCRDEDAFFHLLIPTHFSCADAAQLRARVRRPGCAVPSTHLSGVMVQGIRGRIAFFPRLWVMEL
jgi:hypothetical protein